MTDKRAIIKLKNWCRQFARPRKVNVCDSLDRLANAGERTASNMQLYIHVNTGS